MTAGPERCRAQGCQEPLRRGGRGRPPLYCSPECRRAALGARARLTVEVDHDPIADDTRPAGRVWLVRMRRGPRAIVVASGLGRPSADHLARAIDGLLSPRWGAEGGAME